MICNFCGKKFEGNEEELEICYNCRKKSKVIIKARNSFYHEIDEIIKKITPEMNEKEREKIITIATTEKTYNNFNYKDYYLYDIILEVGEVKFPIYIYGLIDRQEYEIRCTEDILKKLNKLKLANNNKMKTPKGEVNILIEEDEVKRLGISLDLRKNYRDFCIELIRKITN